MRLSLLLLLGMRVSKSSNYFLMEILLLKDLRFTTEIGIANKK